MIEGFTNPALAIGATLAVVPLVIHLLNRRRYKPQRWAAMRFVLAAYQKTRRRVQFENFLLLLARMAAVALFAFALSRPFASGDSPLASLREDRRDLVLMVDASASTGYQRAVDTVHDAILGRAKDLLDELDGSRGDRVRVAIVGATPRLFSWTDPEDARAILESLDEPLDEEADLAQSLSLLADELEEEAQSGLGSALEVRLLTDLQETLFQGRFAAADAEDGDDGTAPPPALAEQIQRFEALDTRILVEDLGARALRPANLAVSALTLLGEAPRVGTPFDVAIEIANHGDQDVLATRVALRVGDTRLPSQRVDVPARGTAEATFTVLLEEAGRHALVASLEGDRLAVDDSRALVVDAAPPLRVLLVNGAPAERIGDDEVGYLAALLEPPDGPAGPNPFDVRVLGAAEFDARSSPIESSDVIVLANVGPISGATAARLEERVAAGASLLVTLGDRVDDVTRWGRNLMGTDGEPGLLPAAPQRIVSAPRRTSYYRVAEFDETAPELDYFADEKRRPLFTEVPIYDFVATEALPGARVLARLSDPRQSPLLVERPFGRGRVALWTTTIDHAWNRIPDSGKTFVPLVLELMEALTPSRDEARNVAAGTEVTVTTAAFPRDALLVDPRGGQSPIEGTPSERADGRWELPTLSAERLARAGVYEVRSADQRPTPIAVQLGAAESDLARTTPAEVESIHRALVVVAAQDGTDVAQAAAAPRSGELWRILAMAALAFLVFESLWGAYVGSRRRRDA